MDALPIDSILPQLRAALAGHPAVVLQAPPGAGKTTGVPPALLGEPWLEGRGIVILEPRRLAARGAAERMAALLGERVGERVGYRIRFENRTSAATRIEVVTEGILTRRLQRDPALEGVGLVVFDEFHERNLHSDLALALCRDAQQGLREDLRLLVMSATLDTGRIAGLLAAPVVASEGRSHPVAVRYLPNDPQGPLPQTVARVLPRVLADQAGDVLVFLPGAGEILRTRELLLAEPACAALAIHTLYGDMPGEAQQRAVLPDREGRRKVILATAIAETSLTIEGVGVVVDGGWSRLPRFDPRSGLTRLETVRVSQAVAEQRAGRAGRLGPGACYRLWSEGTQRGLIRHHPPEILQADLAPVALELALWGVREGNALGWIDPPPQGAMAQARQLLWELGAVDAAGTVTAAGSAMGELPLHPRLARMLLAAQERGIGALACDVAALLAERDIFRGEAGRRRDLTERVAALLEFRRGGRGALRGGGADPAACARVVQAADQWRRALGAIQEARGALEDVGYLVATAYPDRIAQRREGEVGRLLLASGTGARLEPGDPLAAAELLAVAALDGAGEEARVLLAAPLGRDALDRLPGGPPRWRETVRWDGRQQAVVARRERVFGALLLDSRPLADIAPERLAAAMVEGVTELGVDALGWDEEARRLQARILFLRELFPEEGWPDLSDAGLAATLAQWLPPYLGGCTRREHLRRVAMGAALQGFLSWEQRRRLDEGAPTHLEVPSGSRLRLEYAPGQPPVLAVKLQEMFGQADTPRVAWGRAAVALHLLSPARRPIQVTQDLASFWERTYPEVRKELRGRYAKHPWPEDPMRAEPTARAKPRR